MNRRGFLRSLFVTAALTTGLARVRLDEPLTFKGVPLELDDEPSMSEIVCRTLRNRIAEVERLVIANNGVLLSLEKHRTIVTRG